MKERPILFSAPMVRAILEGRKTQTRRVVKQYLPSPRAMAGTKPVPDDLVLRSSGFAHRNTCPYGQPGDRLWVREAWARYNIDQDSHDMAYRATAPDEWPIEGRWRPSIHMPRWASRITLEIVSVRVERLNNITREDAAAEGICYPDSEPKPEWYLNSNWPEQNFAGLWEAINGAGSWQENPWVWVVEFDRVLQNGVA